MTIVSPINPNASYSSRGRNHAMVVPSASTWDGGLPLENSHTLPHPRTLRRSEARVVEDTGGNEIRKDARASVILGALFGLTLTFGVAMGAQDESFEQPPVNSFSAGVSSVAQ